MHVDDLNATESFLVKNQYVLLPGFLAPNEVEMASREIDSLQKQNRFKKTAVGKGSGSKVREEIRGDLSSWFEPESLSPIQAILWARLEGLRENLNHSLFLGLRRLEGHYAVYPPHAFYQKHVDRFQGTDSRLLSIVLYLNENWTSKMGGELWLHPEKSEVVHITPAPGLLVCFLSQVPHEVRETLKLRKSFAGWFRAD